jgi:putative oxidoreductase
MNSFIGLGKYLFAVPFAIFGLLHFAGASSMAGMVPIPGGALWVYITGLAMLAAAVSIFIGKYDKLAMVALAALLVIFVLAIHVPGMMKGGEGAQFSLISILKDLAMAGGALLYAGAYAKDNTYIN